MRAAIIFLALALAGCASNEQIIPATALPAVTKPVTQAVDLRPMCITVKDYSAAAQADLLAAIEALPKSSPIIPAFGDYKRMRDEARACANAASNILH